MISKLKFSFYKYCFSHCLRGLGVVLLNLCCSSTIEIQDSIQNEKKYSVINLFSLTLKYILIFPFLKFKLNLAN